MIEALNLTKYYGRKLAVDRVSFTVADREVVGLLGPNGAGKSTTMRMLTGYLPPSGGRAVIAGLDVAADPIGMKRVIGYLPEQPPLYGEMRVREYLLFVAGLKLLPRSQRGGAVDKAIERCGLMDRARQRIEHLSKGYRQRVGIAQAIVHEPKLVVLDEPTVGLDPKQVIEVRSLIRELARKMTVLVSSHILSEVEATCQRVIIINQGKVVAVDSPAELQSRLNRETGQVIWLDATGEMAVIEQALGMIEGVLSVQTTEHEPHEAGGRSVLRIACETDMDCRNDVARAVLDAGGQLLSLRLERNSLEQAFLRLTREPEHEPNPANL